MQPAAVRESRVRGLDCESPVPAHGIGVAGHHAGPAIHTKKDAIEAVKCPCRAACSRSVRTAQFTCRDPCLPPISSRERILCPRGTSSPVASTRARGGRAGLGVARRCLKRLRPCWLPALRNGRSATLFSSRSPCNAAGAKSSTTSKASFAWNAGNSKAFAVEAELAGSRVASMAAPKCCWHNAASALLNKPLEPVRKRLKPVPPNAAR